MEEEKLTPDHDPHSSKIDPNDPRLKVNKPRGRTLKKGPVIAAMLILLGIVLISVTVALLPRPFQQAKEEPAVDMSKQQIVVPEVIRNAPEVLEEPPPIVLEVEESAPAPVQRQVPQLGQPLPGDLGAAMVQPAGAGPRGGYRQVSPEEQARKQLLKEARVAPLGFGGFEDGGGGAGLNQTMSAVERALDMQQQQLKGGAPGGFGLADYEGGPGGSDGVVSQNLQGKKQNFLSGGGERNKDYLSSPVSFPRSPYEVKGGAIIPATLITGINSDLPGEIIAQVRENVYDTVTGNHLLIPQGSRLLASYDSNIAYAQERALVCWNRLIRPDGSSVNLECAPGVDLAGYAGFADRVNHHYVRLAAGAILSSVLAATAITSQGNISGENATFEQSFASNAGSEINNVGQQITQKNLNVQPTITVRPGFSVNVLVNKDIILPPYRD